MNRRGQAQLVSTIFAIGFPLNRSFCTFSSIEESAWIRGVTSSPLWARMRQFRMSHATQCIDQITTELTLAETSDGSKKQLAGSRYMQLDPFYDLHQNNQRRPQDGDH